MSIRSGIARVNTYIAPTIAFLNASRVPSSVNVIETLGYHQPNGLGAARYRRLSNADPTEAGEQTSNNGQVRWGLLHRVVGGRKQVDVLAYGIQSDDEDITDVVKEIYEGGSPEEGYLSYADVYWTTGNWNVYDYIGVWGDGVVTYGTPTTEWRQHTWGRMVFALAKPGDPTVRPDGVKFFGGRFIAYVNGVPAFYFHSFFSPADNAATEYTCTRNADTTADMVYVFRNGDLLERDVDYTLDLTNPTTASVELNVAHGPSDYANVKITNKWDLFSFGTASLFGSGAGNKANESASIWHGGGDNFEVQDIYVEGFVTIVHARGDWNSDAADRQSRGMILKNIRFHNCEFITSQEMIDSDIDFIIGGTISESQTDNGVRNIYNPAGLIDPVYKDPHVVYWTNLDTLSMTQGVRVGILKGDNYYSSNYKFRNIDGLTVEAGTIEEFHRVVDIEGCNNIYISLPNVRGAFNKHRDSQRCVINLYGVTNFQADIGYCDVESDVTSIVRFSEGTAGDLDGGIERVCENCYVEINELRTNGTSARSSDWNIDHGGINCSVKIKHLVQDGADTGHVMRFRDGNIGSFVGCIGGGISIDKITLLTARTLKISRQSIENATVSTDVVTEFNKQNVIGSPTYDSSTVSVGAGCTNKLNIKDEDYEDIPTNGAVTLTKIIRPPNINLSFTITADRNLTLSTTNAKKGDRFRITRRAGGFNWNIGTGPLKALPADSWCEVMFNGTAWELQQYGLL